MSIAKGIMPIGLLLALGVPAVGQVTDAQNKVLAKRAAEADAYRKLAECVRGLQINSETYVKDFVAESDIIQTAMDTFIKGIRLGEPKWYSDGSCEVPAEVTVAKVVQTLKEIHTRHYKGDRIKAKDIEQMEQKVERKVIKAVGQGAPRPDLPADLPGGVAAQLGGPPTPPDPPLPELWQKLGPQARFMATRAARVDAVRRLAERIQGMRITSDTLVRDFVTESDQIQAVTQATMVGFTEKRTYYHHDEPIVEVTIEVPVESVITTITNLHARKIEGCKVTGKDIETLKQEIKRQTFEATGMGVAVTPQVIAQVETISQTQYPAWATQPIRMTGEGVEPADKAGTPQGKLMAARAAEMDAKRRLAEHIFGLQISSDTLVRDFVAEHDEIQSHMDAILVGSSVEKTEFAGGTAKVTVAVPGLQVWEIIHERIRITKLGG